VQEDKESGNKARAINLQVHHEERGKGRKKELMPMFSKIESPSRRWLMVGLANTT
jgi:hypothetical protein